MINVFLRKLPYRVLLEIYKNNVGGGSITISELILSLDSSIKQTSKVILRMVEQGFLTQRIGKDLRKKNLHLTDSGMVLATEISLMLQLFQ